MSAIGPLPQSAVKRRTAPTAETARQGGQRHEPENREPQPGFLRRHLQRQLDLSIILVRHTRKNGPAGAAAGLALRGSCDLHAFGDSNLYLRRTRDRLLLTSEHRAAPASPPVHLQLVASNAL